MWTFLGIASFTYVYKKYDAYVHKELVVATLLLLAAGLSLFCVRYRGGLTLGAPRSLCALFRLLASLPFAEHLLRRSSSRSAGSKGVASKTVRLRLKLPFSRHQFCIYVLIMYFHKLLLNALGPPCCKRPYVK